MVRRLRAEGEQEVAELAAAVEEAARVARRRPVLEVELDLRDVEAGLHGVDRHPVSTPKPGREREALGRARASRAARCPESGSRASKPQARSISCLRRLLREPEPPALAAA